MYNCYCSILLLVIVVHLFTVPNLQIKLYHRCVCIGKNIYGVSTVHSFRRPLGVNVPSEDGGTTVTVQDSPLVRGSILCT